MQWKLNKHHDKEFVSLVDSIREKVRLPVETLRYFLSAFLTSGHVLLEGFPGTGKTTLGKELARAINADFKRVQFTADLMPSDILGGLIFDKDTATLVLQKGPIFTNVLLADEINRSPPRTQSALLQCMDENQVSIDRQTYDLAAPYFVIATQNPADIQGTFPLPENQLDRFAMKISLPYLSPREEIQLFDSQIKETIANSSNSPLKISVVLDIMSRIKQIEIAEEIKLYAAELVASSRTNPNIYLGGSPRSTFSLLKCSQALAYFDGLDYVVPDYIRELFPYVMKHRLRLASSGSQSDERKNLVIEEILTDVPVPL